MNLQEGTQRWNADKARFAALGVHLPDVKFYTPDNWKRDYTLAMDAIPALTSGNPNSAVPALLTTLIDPQVFRILFAPNKAVEILGEVKKGTWLDETAMFPTVEHVGEVSSYGDYSENGHAGANTNWPQRQAYLFQTIKEYGDRELERAGLARINWVNELDQAAAFVIAKFFNLSYFFGIAGLANYGLVNDPNLSAALTPAPKANGGTKWLNGAALNATANEIYADIEAVAIQLIIQTQGLVNRESKMTLGLSPGSEGALTATNNFNVNVSDLLKKNFPNLRVVSAVQYGQLSASNPQGIAAGNLMQLWADELEGQDTGYSSFNEKLRSHPIVRALSSYKQKQTAGTWGSIIRMPVAMAQMLGI